MRTDPAPSVPTASVPMPTASAATPPPDEPPDVRPIFQNGAWGGDGVDIGWTPFTLTFNLTRQPAATIPCGLDREGLPIGLQIVGGHARDALVLRAAAAYERVRPIPAPPMAHQV